MSSCFRRIVAYRNVGTGGHRGKGLPYFTKCLVKCLLAAYGSAILGYQGAPSFHFLMAFYITFRAKFTHFRPISHLSQAWLSFLNSKKNITQTSHLAFPKLPRGLQQSVSFCANAASTSGGATGGLGRQVQPR